MGKCLHCTEFVNEGQRFCCRGCGVAYKFLHELNLHKYYSDCREIFNAHPKTVIISQDYNYNSHINQNGDFSTILLKIPEVVCGACVWLLEHSLKEKTTCHLAQLNFATRTLKLEWLASEQDLDEIIELINNLGYNAVPISEHQEHRALKQQEKGYLKRIGIAGLGTFFTMMLAICVWAGDADHSMTSVTKRLFYIVSMLVAFPALFYSADVFAKNGWNSLKRRQLDFNCSITIAILTAIALSAYNTFTLAGSAYFDSALALVFALLLGKYLELKMRNHALYECNPLQQISRELYSLEDGSRKTAEHFNENDVILIKRGQTVPVDCELLSDSAALDISIVSGESEPKQIIKGSEIKAGSINVHSLIKIRVLRFYKDSFLYKLQQQVESTGCQTMSAAIAARVAYWFTPFVLFVTCMAVWYWIAIEGSSSYQAFYIASTVLIITCPCAIGIAIPLASYVVTNHLNREHIMLKDAKALERMPRCKNVIFDKTGTLTTAKFEAFLSDLISEDDKRVLRTLASLSAHPKSQMITNILESDTNVQYEDFVEEDLGIRFKHNGVEYRLGNAEYVGKEPLPNTLYFKVGCDLVHTIKYKEQMRKNASTCIGFFKKMKKGVWLLSGDLRQNVHTVGMRLGVDSSRIMADCSSDDKFEIAGGIEEYIMVGDGLNDSLILKHAAVSIGHFDGADLNKYHADVVFKGNDLAKLPLLYKASVQFNKIVRQNFAMAILYNVSALPLAFMGLVTPLVAAIFMSISSICVVMNTMRLR